MIGDKGYYLLIFSRLIPDGELAQADENNWTRLRLHDAHTREEARAQVHLLKPHLVRRVRVVETVVIEEVDL